MELGPETILPDYATLLIEVGDSVLGPPEADEEPVRVAAFVGDGELVLVGMALVMEEVGGRSVLGCVCSVL